MVLISTLKNHLKKNNIFFTINSLLKSYLLKKKIAKLNRAYSNKKNKISNYCYSKNEVNKLITKSLLKRELIINKDTELKVLYVGTNHSQDNSGIIQSLRKFASIELFYRDDGEYGFHSTPINKRNKFYDPLTVKINSNTLLNTVEKLLKKNKINILIGQMWSNYISVNTLKKIRKMGVVIINIAMDDMLPEHWERYKDVRLGAIGLAPEIDLTLNTTKDKCEWYFIDGYPAIFWPLASTSFLYKNEIEIERDIDVSFVGSKYGVRKDIVKYLIDNGINVQAYGQFWENGPLPPKKTAEIFSRSKIILGCGTIGYTSDIFTIKLRDFDAPISGGMYLTHRNDTLKELYEENKEIVLYKDKYECLEKIRFYLLNNELRKKIAISGKNRALKDHNWDLRFQKLFNIIKELS